MEEGTSIEYRGYEIYYNYWEEYCICFEDGNMVESEASRKTLGEAKEYIDELIKNKA